MICENENECLKEALLPCHHCSKQLCLTHIIEHNKLNIIQIDKLSDEVNNLTNSLSNLNTEKTFENARNELNLWKKQSFDNIENIYEFHSNEINHLENELNNRLKIFKESFTPTISNLKIQLSYFKKLEEISQRNLSSIESNLNQLRQCLQSVQCELSIQIKNISFNNLINIQNVFSYNRKLLNSNEMQSYRTLIVENMKEFISSKKNETILWVNNQRQLYFIDKYFQTNLLTLPQMTSTALLSNQQRRKIDVDIVDIKWFSFAEVFLILCQRCLFSFDPKTHKFTQISITRYKDYPFCCISCLNDTSIYISYSTSGVCIELWKYISMNECIKRWDGLTNDKNEWISKMNTNSDLQIGLLIRRGSTIYRRFELRDEQMNFLKKIQLDNNYIDSFFPFRYHHWFIKSLSGKYYIYSTETDTYYLSSFDFPFGLEEFGINTIVIGNTPGQLIYCDI